MKKIIKRLCLVLIDTKGYGIITMISILITKYLNIKRPKNLHTINAFVGLLPVQPRNIIDFSFSVNIDIDDWILQICAHETLHFLWFEKWKQLYPNTKIIEFNSPYLVWKYSEIITDPILNDKPFTDIFKFHEKGYNKFYEITDNEGVLVMDKLRNLFSQNQSIEEKIKIGFEYIKNVKI